MASDVEAMTQLADWLLRCPVHPPTGWQELMVRAISALEPHATDCALVTLRTECDCRLEAREARPKVEGRMGSARLSEILRIHPRYRPEVDEHDLVMELGRARASEAALSKRVAELEEALGRVLGVAQEALKEGGLEEALENIVIVADMRGAEDVPPSKPETP